MGVQLTIFLEVEQVVKFLKSYEILVFQFATPPHPIATAG